MKNKVYFLSDVHLGSVSHLKDMSQHEKDTLISKGIDPILYKQHEVERKLCRWLDMVANDAKAIYLMGDVFDYWFEYKNVVPRGFTRFLGKLSGLNDAGVKLYFFIGNHDIWLTNYLQNECGMTIYKNPVTHIIDGKKFFLGHGDGLGDDSKSFMFLRKMFHSKMCRTLFASLHPRWAVGFAHGWSNSRRANYVVVPYKGEENELLIVFAKQKLQMTNDIDFFVFGHRHIMLDLMLSTQSRIVILGDWISYFSYGVFDGEKFSLEIFETN